MRDRGTWELCPDNWRNCDECGEKIGEGEEMLVTTADDSDLRCYLCSCCGDEVREEGERQKK